MTKRVTMSAAGIEISKPGYDVDTATLAQLALALGLNYGQIMQEGDANASGSVTLTGYGATPLCFFYAYQPSNMQDPSGAAITAFHIPDAYTTLPGSSVQISNTSLDFTLSNAAKCRWLLARAGRV